jgi:hypothetical protein
MNKAPGKRGSTRSVYLTNAQNAVIDRLRAEQGWAFNRIAQAALEAYFAQRSIEWPATYPELQPAKKSA